MTNPDIHRNVNPREFSDSTLRADDDGYLPLKIDHDREAPPIKATLFTSNGEKLPTMDFTVDGLSAMIKAGFIIGGTGNPETPEPLEPKPEGPKFTVLKPGEFITIKEKPKTQKKRPTRKTAA